MWKNGERELCWSFWRYLLTAALFGFATEARFQGPFRGGSFGRVRLARVRVSIKRYGSLYIALSHLEFRYLRTTKSLLQSHILKIFLVE